MKRRTIRQRIVTGLEAAGRPLTRIELTGWFLNSKSDRALIPATLAAMLSSGELVNMGMTLHRDREWNATPRQTYGLPGVIYSQQIAEGASDGHASKERRR